MQSRALTQPCYQCVTSNDKVRLGKTGELGLSGNSFSFLCWIKLNDVCSSPSDQFDQTVLGQRYHSAEECVHIVIRNMKAYFGFYEADTASETLLFIDTWYHLACVYDMDTRSQSIYLNGKLDARSSNLIPPLRGNHELFLSWYANGRPLKGLIAAPSIQSQHIASKEDIRHHMLEYSIQHAQDPEMIHPCCQVTDETWPPAKLAHTISLAQSAVSVRASDEFLSFFESGVASDATVRCNGQSFRVHKIIVASRSRYFHSVFVSSGMKEQDESIVDLHDLDPGVLFLFLEALYTNRVNPIHTENVDIIMHLLDSCSRFEAMSLGRVVELLAISILTTSSTEDISRFLALSNLHQFSTLKEACLAFQEFHETYF